MNMDTKTQDGEVFEFFNKNKLVCKISGSPFKSGRKINRVKGLVVNEQYPKKRLAYTFYEDDSCVNAELCTTDLNVVLKESSNLVSQRLSYHFAGTSGNSKWMPQYQNSFMNEFLNEVSNLVDIVNEITKIENDEK